MLVACGPILTKKLHFIYNEKEREKCFFKLFYKIFVLFFLHFLGIYNKFIKFLKDLNNILISLYKTFSLIINGQHFSINIGLTSRLIFKYQSWLENSKNYFEYSLFLIESIFHHNIQVLENAFVFQDRWTLLGHLHGFFL